MDAAARIEALEAENERLKGRIDQLEAAAGHNFAAPTSWGLTAHETRLLGVLMARRIATKDAIMAGIYRDRGVDAPEIKIVDVFICKLRKKIRDLGLTIETKWGEGYHLTPETKARINDLLAQGDLL